MVARIDCMQVNERIEESGKECKHVTLEIGIISYSWNFAELLDTAGVFPNPNQFSL
jgi:hypothetical protein